MYKDPLKRKKKLAEWYVKNKASVAARCRHSYLTRRALHLAWEAKRRAARKKVPYTLTSDDVAKLQSLIDIGFCEITGTPFDLETDRAWNSPSLDQIEAGKGYVAGNVRVVCRAMNFAMSDWGEGPVWEMFRNWVRVLKLRGAGDAICAETAKAFIESYLEVTPTVGLGPNDARGIEAPKYKEEKDLCQ